MLFHETRKCHWSIPSRVVVLLTAWCCAADCPAADLDSLLSQTGFTGGLCVHLAGGGDGSRTVRLAQGGKLLVHRLDNNASRVAKVRRFIESKGLYGQISVEHWSSRTLPYADNLVNILVADDTLGISEEEMLRVLCPKGTMILKQGESYRMVRKPRSSRMGEWTHPWHGANGNMFSEDTYLGIPNGIQWVAGPLFPLDARKSSAHGLVSANGRIFTLTQNELSNLNRVGQSPPNFLVARDAYNGLRLWQRPWKGPVIDGTSTVSIIADGDRVFGLDGNQFVILNAATGELLRRLPTPDLPNKILFSDGLLVAAGRTGISAIDVNTGTERWHFSAAAPYGTVVDGGRVFCLVGTRQKSGRWLHEVLGLDLQSGKELWRKPVQSEHAVRNSSALRIHFAANGILCLVDRQIVRILSAKNGREIWSKTSPAEGRGGWDTRLVGHFYGQGLIWMRQNDSERKREAQEVWHGLDPLTGELKRELKTSGNWPRTANPAKMGCQPLMATARFIMFPRQATYVDFETGEKNSFKFARGGCVLGAIPANGLAYVTPHACGCFSETLRGFIGLTSTAPSTIRGGETTARLQRGPAFAAVQQASSVRTTQEWPTYRHDVRRSGSSGNQISTKLRLRWSAQVAESSESLSNQEWKLRVGTTITSPVIAEGKVFVGFPEAHRMIALNAETGKPSWQFTAGGRIDTPPTIHSGLCLFGAHDGWVYCLRARDGQLVWRFRAAPMERRILAFGQLESAWPVAGTVLVQNGLAYVAAGRSPDSAGGIRVTALHPRTGRVVWTESVSDDYFGLCDFLIGDEKRVYLSNWQFDPKTGRNQPADPDANYLRGGKVGLLESSWTRIEMALRKRIHDWTYGDAFGQLLVFSRGETFGYQWTEDGSSKTLPSMLFASGKSRWSVEVPDPIQIEALILTRDALFAAGPRDRLNREQKGGVLLSISKTQGRSLAEIPLPAPAVYDGLAAAYGRLYVATEDGKLLCFGGPNSAD